MTAQIETVTPGCLCGPCMIKKSVAFDSMISRTAIDEDRFILTVNDPENEKRFVTYTVDVKDGGVVSQTQSASRESAISDHLRALTRLVAS